MDRSSGMAATVKGGGKAGRGGAGAGHPITREWSSLPPSLNLGSEGYPLGRAWHCFGSGAAPPPVSGAAPLPPSPLTQVLQVNPLGP